jgi:hypothetical protein
MSTATTSLPVATAASAAPDRQLARRLVIAAGVAAALCAAIYVLFVHTAIGQRFDNAALVGGREQLPATRIADTAQLRRITGDSFLVVLVLIVAFGWLRRRWRLGLSVAVAAAFAVLFTDLLRRALLHRPPLVTDSLTQSWNTFPSGHTATAISCALALVVVSPPAWRGISAVIAGSFAWFTAAAVQTAGWHRPSDAIGAAFLSFAAVAVMTAIVAWYRPVGIGRRFGHVPAFGVLAVVWLYCAAAGALNAARVLRFLANNDAAAPTTPAILSDAYSFSTNLTIVVVVSLLALLLLLLGRADLDQPRS